MLQETTKQLDKTNISAFPYQRATKPRKLNKTQKIFKELTLQEEVGGRSHHI
jgi:hypothetical protein